MRLGGSLITFKVENSSKSSWSDQFGVNSFSHASVHGRAVQQHLANYSIGSGHMHVSFFESDNLAKARCS